MTDNYITKNLWGAAYLLMKGYKIKEVQNISTYKFVVFESVPNEEVLLLNQFASHNKKETPITVDLLAFRAKMDELKKIINS